MKNGKKTIKITLVILMLLGNIFAYDIPDSIKTNFNKMTEIERVKYLGQLCWDNRVVSTSLAIEYGTMAIALAARLDLQNDLAQINNYLGVAYVNYNYNAKKAVMCFRNALEAGLKVQDSVQIAYAYNNLGDVYIFNRNFPLALKYSENAAKYFEKLNNLKGISYSYINLGEIYRYKKQFDLSLHFLRKALDIRENLHNSFNIAGSIFHIAETYFAMKNYDEALNNYEKAIPFYNEYKDFLGTANCYVGIGNIEYSLGKYKASVANFVQAEKIYKELKNNDGLVGVYTGLARVYSLTGKRREGELILKKALSLAKQADYPTKIKDAYEAYAEFYENVKDFKSATNSFKDFLTFHDSLLSVEREDIISEIQKNYDIAKQVEEIQYDLERGKREELYLELMILFLLVSVGFFFWRYRINRTLNKKLNQLNDTKDKFFKVVSHDLKSPFNSLMAFASLLYNDFDELSAEQHRDGLREIQNSATRVYKLLENLLDWSRIQTDSIELNPEKLNAGEAVELNCNLYEMSASNKKISLNREISEDDIFVLADSHMFNSIMRNLISNAIKFTPEGGEITVAYQWVNERVIFEVKDTGTGMEEEMVNKIFDKKSHISTNGTNKESGTGLGLILCHEFVTKMGGEIFVESKLNTGTRFYFYLKRFKT